MSATASEAICAQMLAEAERCAPLEACGLLGGHGDGIVRFVPCRNARKSARVFEIPAEDVAAAVRAFRREGIELIGVFHSHPNGPARPSAHDEREGERWDHVQVIAALPARELRAFRRQGGRTRELELRRTAGESSDIV